jgi:ankyrin repeat protein
MPEDNLSEDDMFEEDKSEDDKSEDDKFEYYMSEEDMSEEDMSEEDTSEEVMSEEVMSEDDLSEDSEEEEKDFNALVFAVQQNFVEIAKCLLFHLIRTKELKEKDLNKLLLKAAIKGHTKIAHELLINGAEVNYETYLAGIISNYHEVSI